MPSERPAALHPVLATAAAAPAPQAALLINLYQDEPILNQAFRFLQAIQDIDELMTQWRHVRGRSNP